MYSWNTYQITISGIAVVEIIKFYLGKFILEINIKLQAIEFWIELNIKL